MMRASDLFSGNDPDSKVKAARNWLNEQGVRDLEAVPLSTEALDKVRHLDLIYHNLMPTLGSS